MLPNVKFFIILSYLQIEIIEIIISAQIVSTSANKVGQGQDLDILKLFRNFKKVGPVIFAMAIYIML